MILVQQNSSLDILSTKQRTDRKVKDDAIMEASLSEHNE